MEPVVAVQNETQVTRTEFGMSEGSGRGMTTTSRGNNQHINGDGLPFDWRLSFYGQEPAVSSQK